MKKTLILLPVILLCLCGFQQRGPEQTELSVGDTSSGNAYEQAVSKYESRDYPEAIDAFSKAIELGQSESDAYIGRGDSYLAMALEEKGAGNGPDRVSLAIMDYMTAITLSEGGINDPAAEGLERAADHLSDEGNITRAMECLRLAMDASDGDVYNRVKTQAGELILDQMISTAAWYMNADPYQYYEFFKNGTGRIINTTNMEISDTFMYQNDGFDLHIVEGSSNRSYEWMFSPEEQVFSESAASMNGDYALRRTTMKRVFQEWEDRISNYYAYGMEYEWIQQGQTGMSIGAADTMAKWQGLLDAIIETQAQALTDEEAARLRGEREAWEEERFKEATESGMDFFGGSAQAMIMSEASIMYYSQKVDDLLSGMADNVFQ